MGLEFRGQVAPRAVGAILGLSCSLSPFSSRASYQKIAGLPLAEKVREMRKPEVRKRILSEGQDPAYARLDAVLDSGNWIWEMDEFPDYEPMPEDTLAARAARAGQDPMEFTYDRLIAEEGTTLFYSARANYKEGNFNNCREMLTHEDTVIGLGDGGAHVGIICDGSFNTSLLAHWGRDLKRGEKIDLATLVKYQTSDTARAVGLNDRGYLKVGMKADVNVIDYDNLRARVPRITHDLPAGGSRFQQDADGYLATMVNGLVTYRNGEATDALPGRIIRPS